MENYRIQLRIKKENVPSLLQFSSEDQLWNKVKEMVRNGEVELTILERDDDFVGFNIPTQVKKKNEDWESHFKGDLILESEMFLKGGEENDKDFVIRKFSEHLDFSNLELYSYYLGGNLYRSYGYIDTSDFNSTDDDDMRIEELEKKKAANEQLDMFKKKRKSK